MINNKFKPINKSTKITTMFLAVASVLTLGMITGSMNVYALNIHDVVQNAACVGVLVDCSENSKKINRDGENGNGEKVTICHVPPGNPENAQTLELSENGAQNHLENHEDDYPGECRSTTPELIALPTA